MRSTAGCCALIAGMVGGSVGCAVDQKKDVALYRGVLDEGIAGAPAATPQEFEQQRLTVTDAMRLANLRNESLAIAGEDYVQALIDKRRAAATFLPTISLSPTYLWRDEGGGGPSNNRGWNTSIDTELAVNPVRDVASLKRAGSTAEEQRALLLDFQDGLLIDVARAHYEVIRGERAVEVIESSLKVQDERVSDARVRLGAGLVRPLDLSLTEAQAAQTAATLTQAQVLARTARSEMAFLTATPMNDRELVDALELPADLPSLSDALEVARRLRQDLIAASRRIDAAGHQVESAYGQYFPSVSLNLQWFLERQTNPTELEWSSLIQISLPLFSAGLIEADVRTALSILRQAKLNFSLTERTVERDIEVAIENLLESLERAQRVRVQVKSASDALEQSEGLYQVGLATNLERLTAQNALLNAELDLINAELDAKVFYLDLRRTSGTLHQLLGLTRRPEAAHAVAR